MTVEFLGFGLGKQTRTQRWNGRQYEWVYLDHRRKLRISREDGYWRLDFFTYVQRRPDHPLFSMLIDDETMLDLAALILNPDSLCPH